MLSTEKMKAIENDDILPVVFINCRKYPFCDSILNGFKKYETRTRNTLHDLVGKTCLFCETGHGKPKTRFYARIDYVTRIDSAEVFEQYRNDCDIIPGSEFDWKPGTSCKYLYHPSDITGEDAYPITFSKEQRHGRTWAEYWVNYPNPENN